MVRYHTNPLLRVTPTAGWSVVVCSKSSAAPRRSQPGRTSAVVQTVTTGINRGSPGSSGHTNHRHSRRWNYRRFNNNHSSRQQSHSGKSYGHHNHNPDVERFRAMHVTGYTEQPAVSAYRPNNGPASTPSVNTVSHANLESSSPLAGDSITEETQQHPGCARAQHVRTAKFPCASTRLPRPLVAAKINLPRQLRNLRPYLILHFRPLGLPTSRDYTPFMRRLI